MINIKNCNTCKHIEWLRDIANFDNYVGRCKRIKDTYGKPFVYMKKDKKGIITNITSKIKNCGFWEKK